MNAVPKRVVIDGRPFSEARHTGYVTYLNSIIEPLLAKGFQITLVSNQPLNPAHTVAARCQSAVFGSKRDWAWEQFGVPHYLQQHHADIYLVGVNHGLPWRKVKGTRYILGLLDIIPYKLPRLYLFSVRYLLRELKPLGQLISIIRADELLTISRQSAKDITALFHRSVTPLWLKLDAHRLASDPLQLKPQFAYVGGVDARKKVGTLIEAFADFHVSHPEYQLVLIGRGYEIFGPMIAGLGLTDKVVMTGFVNDEVKFATIAESMAMVYPSLYEGYGLAIAEGFVCGVPVIAGRGGSQAEIGGEGVLYIDPMRADEIAAAMERVLNPDVRRNLALGREEQLDKLLSEKVETDITDFFDHQVELARRRR